MDKSFAILVVDDFKTMSRILCKMAQEIGFADVDQVHDGYSALDRLRQKRYGLVISDWNMQPMSGAQLVQAMKAEPALAAIPTILITAQGSRHDEAWLTGADGYLNKPFTATELDTAIQEVFARRAEEMRSAS
jgi:two-component system, chemotaxis family, chemotaxis protein CheY